MSYNIDFTLTTSSQIEKELCLRIEKIRLSRNMPQEQLAIEAGISLRTIGRLEKGQGVSLDTFIRVLMALHIQENFKVLLPDPDIRPIERVKIRGRERKRARSKSSVPGKSTWIWGDEADRDE